MTDAELARRVALGDAAAFEELVGRHLGAARRAARLVAATAEDADDAVQEALLSVWRRAETFDGSRPFRPWFLRVVLNAVRALRRGPRGRTFEALDERVAATAPGPGHDAARAELRDALARALATLPDRARLAVTLYDAEGWSHREIATALGVPEGTVRSDVHHARRALRARLGAFAEGLA